MHYFKLHIGDYAQATAHLTWLEDAAYLRCLRKYYSDHGLPAKVSEVQRLVGARSKQEKDAVDRVLKEFFFIDGDLYRNNRADKEIAEAEDKSLKAKGSANKRWMRSHSDGIADAEPSQSEGNAIHNPLSIIQEPIKKRSYARRTSIPKPEDVSEQVWEDFLDVRKKKSAPMTLTALTMICVEVEKSGLTLEEALKVCIQYNWQTFNAKWYAERKPKAQENWEAAGWK